MKTKLTKKSKRSGWITILGYGFNRRRFYTITLISCTCLLFLALLLGLLVRDQLKKNEHSTHITAEPSSSEKKKENLELTENNLPPLLHHLEQTGYREVQSFRATGSIKFENFELNMILYGRQPNLYKQKVERYKKKSETGYDGRTLWQSQNYTSSNKEDESILKFRQTLALFQGAIPHLAWHHESPIATLGSDKRSKYLEEVTWNEKICFIIENTSLLEVPVFHYIEKETGIEVYRYTHLPFDREKKKTKKLEILYAPVLPDQAHPFCSGYELRIDEEWYAEVQFEKVQFNLGLIKILFQKRDL